MKRLPGRVKRVSIKNVCPQCGVREYGRFYQGRIYCPEHDSRLQMNQEVLQAHREILANQEPPKTP